MMFIELCNISPMLTCQYAYFLALLNHCDRIFWDRILGGFSTLSAKLVQHCGVVSMADYLVIHTLILFSLLFENEKRKRIY